MMPGLRFTIEMFAQMWLEFDEKINQIDLEMKKQAAKDIAIETVYQSVCGIGPTKPQALAIELEELHQFKN